ncbi:MAG: DUF1702 family protein [bacterium]|nr:DUF1702 family protein [bacterium]
MRWLYRSLFGLSLEEVTFERRGFRGGDARMRARLERVGISFLHGYHAALEHDPGELLERRLEEIEGDQHGFAYEGAAMALTLLDLLSPWRRQRRLDAFLAGRGGAHVYMVHVGTGWAIARLPVSMRSVMKRLDPLLRWLAMDGYGFHEGYFHWPRSVDGRKIPRRLSGYARRAFDQGLGRSLWFVEGAEVERIATTIGSFPAARRADLWCGIGLSSTYAGGLDREGLTALLDAGHDYRHELAQGSAFAAEARRRAGNPAPHNELTCRLLCGLSVDDAARLTATTRRDLPDDGEEPAFEVWKKRIQEGIVTRAGAAERQRFATGEQERPVAMEVGA